MGGWSHCGSTFVAPPRPTNLAPSALPRICLQWLKRQCRWTFLHSRLYGSTVAVLTGLHGGVPILHLPQLSTTCSSHTTFSRTHRATLSFPRRHASRVL